MPKKLAQLLIVCFCCLLPGKNAWPQPIEIERLIETLQEKQGQEKIDACSELSFLYFRIDPVKGLFYGNLALMIADSLNLAAAKSKAWNSLGANYLSLANHDSARISFQKALHYAGIYNDTLEIATANTRLGVLYEKTGLFDSALVVFHQALVLYSQLVNCERTGVLNENIGMLHLNRGEQKTALTHFLKAESLYDSCGLKKQLSSVYLKIGRVYAETGEYETAEKWYQRGKLLAIELSDYQTVGIAINAIGILLKNQGKNEEALNIYMEVIALEDKINNPNLLQAAYGNIANVYQNLGDYRKALEYNMKALRIAETLNNPVQQAQRHVGIGDAYLGLKEYDKALYHLEIAIPVFEASKAQSNLLVAYNNMIKASKGLGKYETAVAYFEKSITLKDSLNRNELNTALDSLKVKFNTEQTLRDNTLLMQQSEVQQKTIILQKITMVFAFLLTSLLLGFIAVVVRNRQKVKKANELLSLKNEEIRAKAEELQAKNKQLLEFAQYKDKMNSFLVHDLKNPLNSVINIETGVLTSQQAESIRQSGRQMLNIVSNLLDISKLENNMMKLSLEDKSLAEVIHQAFNETAYFARQKSIKMTVEFRRDFFVKADQEIIKRVFVNFFTNAIKFSQTGGLIKVFAEVQTDSKVKIAVQDDGEGISPEYLPYVFDEFTQGAPRNLGYSVSTGIGLTFCKLAVEAHGGNIGVISEKGQGASFWFTLPLSGSSHKGALTEQGFTLNTGNLTPFKLTLEEKQYLMPFCKTLENKSVSQLTDVKAIVNTVAGRSDNILLWKSLILQALSDCNELKYQELISFCYDESL